jgi:hypothetical protein
MDESKSGMTWIGVLFVILVIWAIFGGGFGNFGGMGHQMAQAPAAPIILGGDALGGGCNRVSNCEIERREIIDSANTQYKLEQQGAQTRAEVQAGVNSIIDQNNRIYIQGLQTQAFDLKMENQALKNQLYSDAKFNALTSQISECCCGFNSQLDSIRANMLTKPELFGVASTCSGQLIPAVTA